VGTFTQNAQVWIIKALLGTEAVGLYAFATGIMSNISSLIPFTDVFTSLGPKYIEKRDELIALVRNSVRMQLLATLVLIAGAIVLLPVLVYFLPKYKPALPLTILMLLVVIPTSATAVFTPTFALFKEQFEFLKTVCVKLFLTVVIVPLSIVTFGLLGIGIASITVNTLSGFERYARLKRFFHGFSLEFSTLLSITKNDIAFVRKLAGKALSRDIFAQLLVETKSSHHR
jgi:O-antigen/teichoic acid export membrane protein